MYRKTSKFLPVIVAALILTSVNEAKAWKLFGKEKTTISGMDCVQDPSGAWGRYYTQKPISLA